MKAIETQYRGYRFRSRTEARWAVFFDYQRIQWVYEPEGFSLPSGPYLPDFWLPQVEMFAEVKGKAFLEVEVRKCRDLAAASGHPVLLLAGPPSNRYYTAAEPWPTDDDDEPTWFMEYDLMEIHRYWETQSRFFSAPGGSPAPYENHPALWAARSARFEHGETPRVICR